ncbi:hypothetical protein GCM10022232_90270 [Streptomyces plumbiresistens]|uniref:Protein export membrane protein SecD/SecF C-terminal domain-containing protein n=1 Tax=Streptomyces plumbiresistens TaxID=511811 RepID=A0ABP7TRS4_9ACTN
MIDCFVNDSVVVFDRIRELSRRDKAPFARTAKRALRQAVPRTVNAGIGAGFIFRLSSNCTAAAYRHGQSVRRPRGARSGLAPEVIR